MVNRSHSCCLYSFLLFGAIWLFFGATDGACTWPPDFLSSTWVDSSKGELVFKTTTMTGWFFTAGTLLLNEWECHTTEFLDSHGYLIMKTKDTFIQFFTQVYHGYRCLHITKITEASYRYYEISPIQTANLQFERILVHDLATTEPPSGVSELCLTEHGATGSEYKLLIKKGHEEQAKIRCPYNILGDYDYTHTSSSGAVTCTGEDKLDMCTNNKEMKFNYDTCPTKVAYSASDTVWCFDSVPVGENNYVTVYNAFDESTDNVNTYRFSCFGVSADGTSASVTPQNCKKDQTPYDVPVDNSGTSVGATITMPTASTPCPILSSQPKGEVFIATDGAVTIATYTCTNNYTIAGDATRTCQENNTWSGNTPSCTCETPKSPTNGAVTVSADGTTATYTCIANFTLDGDVTRTCQADTNTWTGSHPTCTHCYPLDMLENGNVTVGLTDADTVSIAVYTCEAGATLNGVTSRKCLTDGTWTDTKPTCTSCPALVTSQSSILNLTTNGTTTSATVSCSAGYTVIGEQEYNCLANGSWDAVEPKCVCNSPTPPVNGSLSVLDGNTTAVYTCDFGFTLNGSSQRSCLSDGTGWSGIDPTCVLCQSLSSTEGLHISVSTNGTISAAMFMCDIKYTLRGYSLINCQASGVWEYESPTCEKCSELTSPKSGSLLFSTNGTSTTANFNCITGTSLQGQAVVECNTDGSWSSVAASCVECDKLEGLQDGSYVVSSNGITSEVIYSCADGYTLTGSSQAICRNNGTWDIETKPFCSQDSDEQTFVTESDSSLLPAVIALAVLAIFLIAVSSVATYCYCAVKKASQTKGYSMRDDDIPKSIPIAAVPPSAAPIDHQKPLFDGGRATALSMAPESHRQSSNRSLFSANSRLTTASISRLNLEMIRETTSSSVYDGGVPAPWSSSKDSIASGSTDLPRMNSPTMSSLYSGYSSPRRGYTQTPRYTDDSKDTARASPMTDDNVYRETPSPRKSPKKRKKALRKLSHADIDEHEPVPSYMRETKASTSKTYQEMMLNDNKQSSRISLLVTGNEKTSSKRSTPKLTSPRV